MPRQRATGIELTDALVEDAAARVRAARFVPKAKLVPGKLSRADEVVLIERLAARGLERTARGVRVAVAEQVRGAIGAAERLTLPELAARVVGATRAEIRRAAMGLVGAGELVLLPATRGDAFAKPGPHVLSPGELETARDVAQALAKLIARVKARRGSPPRTLERAELRALVAPLAELAELAEPAGAGAGGSETTTSRVLAKLTELGRERGRSVFIPDVLRALHADRDGERQIAHAALLELARAGRVELRPESGVGNLSEQDRALCPSGADGLVISYARVVAGGGGA